MIREEANLQEVYTALAEARRKLGKAEHDRRRYAKRIRILQAQQAILSRETNALRLERDILKTALTACEACLYGTAQGKLSKPMKSIQGD